MSPEPTCLQCSRIISSQDTVERDGDRVVHLDCRRPRRLTREEQTLLYEYCWNHVVARCVSCARSFRQHQLSAGLFGDDTDLCPRCGKDLTDAVRAHLYSCAMLPAEVRRRAQEIRAASQQLMKQSGELTDRADVVMREAEALRDAMKRSAFEGLRHIIRVKLRNRSLPHDGIPSTIPGRPGDDSACAVCAHGITTRDLMMVVITRLASQLSAPNKVTSVHLHADCFELWNEERRMFRPGS